MSNAPKAHVLVVEDDQPSRAVLAYLAEDQGRVRVSQAATASEMHAVLARDAANLIILDLNLPDENGLSLARQLRTRSDVPIIVVTGDVSRDTRLAALEIGVDDFQTKPYDLKELGLRIRNQLRRSMAIRRPGQVESSARVAFDRYVLDHSERILERSDGVTIHLTRNEFMILAALLRRRNSSVSRAALLDAIGNADDGPSDRAIDIYIKNLRAKIEADQRDPRIISTVRGFGYRLTG
ncbi:response regulator transcription factor [Thalassobaculum sp.]|uniref:response regulator transcription factor n=1 Tax=Thalassobaculum sp. TaxID=2022740 RepID=UPI0032EF8F24